MSPEEAARAFDETHTEPEPGPTAKRKVKISAAARSVRVIGDPTVTEASVDGRHRAHHTSGTLHIDGTVKPNEDHGFSFDGPAGWHRQWQHWRQFTEPLVVRVHPAAALDIELSAGSLSVQDVTGPLTVVLAAGSARLDDVSGPLNIETRAGALRISGRIDADESRIRCEAGSVSLHLSEGSSVRIRAHAELGRVRVAGLGPTDSVFGASRQFTVGSGNGALDIDTTMGSIEIFSRELVVAGERS